MHAPQNVGPHDGAARPLHAREVRQRVHIAIPAIGPAVGQDAHAKVKVRRAIVNCITAQPNLLRRVHALTGAYMHLGQVRIEALPPLVFKEHTQPVARSVTRP